MTAVAEANEEDAFAVLRHDALRVNHAVVNVVFQVVGEDISHRLKISYKSIYRKTRNGGKKRFY